MRKFSATALVGVVALAVSVTAAGQTQVPHTFQAGQPANASEVNDNFSEIEVGITQNASDVSSNSADIAANTALIQDNQTAIGAIASTLQLYADGSPIGRFLEVTGNYRGMSDQNYLFDVIFAISPGDTTSAPGDIVTYALFFKELGCSGQAFATRDWKFDLAEYSQGIVFRSPNPDDPAQLYFVPSGSADQEIQDSMRSRIRPRDGTCTSGGGTGRFIPVLPNDPDITGVTNARFATPVLIGR